MKILILSTSEDNYSTLRLIEEIKKRGEEYEVISPSDLYAYISSTVSGHDRVYRKTDEESERILSKSFNAIIPRFGGAIFEHGAMILKQFNESMGIFSTSCEAGLRISSNKLTTSQVLSANKIRVPKQILSHQPNDYKELIDMVGGLPCIAKLQRGSLGVGVMILNDEQAASTSLQSFQTLGANVILQQYINTGSVANDLRVFVIGASQKSPTVIAYKRYALDEEFRSNYSISGKGEKVDLTREEKEMSIKAAKILGLEVTGVDIMRDANDKNKPYLIEVNGNPGLKGIESVTNENVAGTIVDFVVKNYKKGGGPRTVAETYEQQTSASIPGFSTSQSIYYANKFYNEINMLLSGKSIDTVIKLNTSKNQKNRSTGKETIIKLGKK